jgi:hypothetical protein
VSVRARSLLAWIAVGLAGLALAAGVTYAATQLSSQRIGLQAEPPSAGEELAPKATARMPRHTSTRHEDRTATTGNPMPEERGEHRRGSGSGDQDD